MAIVLDRSHRWRVVAAHAFLICLCALVIFPCLGVISISLRPGNFATGSIIPDTISLEHWRFALGLPFQDANGRLVEPDLPVLRWLWNSVKVATLSGLICLFLSTTAAYAFARMKFRGKKQALTGLMLMRAYFADRGEGDQRDTIITADTAHGTNPASVTMAGYKLEKVATTERGNLDLDDLRAKVSERTAGLMLTNPSTLGLFDEGITEDTDEALLP